MVSKDKSQFTHSSTLYREGSGGVMKENSTKFAVQVQNSTAYYDHLNPGTPYDVAMDALLAVALSVSVYLLFVLILHEWTVGRGQNSNNARTSSRKKIRMAPLLRSLCILSAFFCMMRCINDIVYYKTSKMNDLSCTLLKNIGASWLLEVDTTVYLFLWFRQRVLYRKKAMKNVGNPVTTLASWSSLFLIAAIFLVLNILLGWKTYRYDYNRQKCSSNHNVVFDLIPTIWAASSTILHILLVSLYAYPLIRQSLKFRTRTNVPANSGSPNPSNPLNRERERQDPTVNGRRSLMTIVIRCVIISLVCVMTDGLVIIATRNWFDSSEQTKFRHFLYNINVVLNTFCIVFSFKNWRRMLLPWYLFSHRADATETPSRTAQDPAKREFISTTTIGTPVHNRI